MVFATCANAQGRGFNLEKIMYDLSDLFDLDPKVSFRNADEQFDGAFSLDGTVYLSEVNWLAKPMAAAELDPFAAIVNRKRENSLVCFFLSTVFSGDGIAAHSSGRVSIMLMDGADLMALLENELTLLRFCCGRNGTLPRLGRYT